MMCSGKDTVAEMLYKKGYTKVSMSEDVLKPILKSLKLRPDRLNYIRLSKSLKSFKPEVLSFLIHNLMNKGQGHKYVIPNIMHFQEARFLKRQKDIKFILLKVSTDQMTRYERNLQRKDEKDVNDLPKFKNLDLKNLTNTGLKELMHAGLEDAEIINNGSLEELKMKVEKIIQKFDL